MSLSNHSAFVLNDGTVKTVGHNTDGQTGNGNTTTPQLTMQTPSLSNVKKVSAGGNHTVFLLNDKTIRAVGRNISGELGIGNTTNPQPTLQTPAISNVKDVVCGSNYTFFLMEDGTVRSVGSNSSGQLGTGNVTSQSTLQTPSISNVKQIACGNGHTVFLLNDGTVKSVGANTYGELGDGNTTTNQGIRTPNISNVKQVACGNGFTVFLLNDGTVKAVGLNNHGQLGNRNTTNQTTFQTVGIADVKQVSCGGYHSTFLLNDGTVRTVGRNSEGQLGIGDTISSQSTLQNPNLSNVKEVVGGNAHTAFLFNDGTVKTVGYNYSGQLGNGNTTTQTTPVIANVTGVKSLWDYIKLPFADKYFIQDGSNIKVFQNNSWVTIGQAPLTSALTEQGMDKSTITNLTLSSISQLTSSTPEILCWTEGEPLLNVTLTINAWDAVSATLPSVDLFNSQGMDNLSFLNRVNDYSPLDELVGDFDLVTYTNVVEGDKTVQIQATPTGQLVLSETNFSNIEDLTITGSASDVKIIVSGNGGSTWKTYNNGWQDITTDGPSVKASGMDILAFNALTSSEWAALGSNVRLGYFIENDALLDNVKVSIAGAAIETPTLDSIKITFDELTIEGRLKDLERINAINLAKLNFKSNALIHSDKYDMHDMVVDTCDTDEIKPISSSGAGEKVEINKAFANPVSVGVGTVTEYSLSASKYLKKVEVK